MSFDVVHLMPKLIFLSCPLLGQNLVCVDQSALARPYVCGRGDAVVTWNSLQVIGFLELKFGHYTLITPDHSY